MPTVSVARFTEIADFLQLCRIDLFDAHIELLHSELK